MVSTMYTLSSMKIQERTESLSRLERNIQSAFVYRREPLNLLSISYEQYDTLREEAQEKVKEGKQRWGFFYDITEDDITKTFEKVYEQKRKEAILEDIIRAQISTSTEEQNLYTLQRRVSQEAMKRTESESAERDEVKESIKDYIRTRFREEYQKTGISM